MLLTFSTTYLVDKILEGTKKHTIREDKTDRWKVGMKIHAWYKNPRNVKQNPMDLYNYATYYGYGSKKIEIPTKCRRIQSIILKWDDGFLKIKIGRKLLGFISESGRIHARFEKNRRKIETLIKNDGFDNPIDFYHWFAPICKKKKDNTYIAKIIHWTDLQY